MDDSKGGGGAKGATGRIAEDDSARTDARPARALCPLSGSISGVN